MGLYVGRRIVELLSVASSDVGRGSGSRRSWDSRYFK